MNDQQIEKPEWVREFELVRFNAIYFLEEYYNKTKPESAVTLTDDEKQDYYDRYKGARSVGSGQYEIFLAYLQRIKELKEQGYKDWEILL